MSIDRYDIITMLGYLCILIGFTLWIGYPGALIVIGCGLIIVGLMSARGSS